MKPTVYILILVCVSVSAFYIGRVTYICPARGNVAALDTVIRNREFAIDTLLIRLEIQEKQLKLIEKLLYEKDSIITVPVYLRPVYTTSELERKLSDRAARFISADSL